MTVFQAKVFAATIFWAAVVAPFAQAETARGVPPGAAAGIEAAIARDERPSPAQAIALARQGALLLDVRSTEEWSAGHAKGALFLPWRQIDNEAASKLPNKDTPIVTYCAVGVRAWYATRALRKLGYTHVTAMTGGFDDLKALGYPVADAAAGG